MRELNFEELQKINGGEDGWYYLAYGFAKVQNFLEEAFATDPANNAGLEMPIMP